MHDRMIIFHVIFDSGLISFDPQWLLGVIMRYDCKEFAVERTMYNEFLSVEVYLRSI